MHVCLQPFTIFIYRFKKGVTNVVMSDGYLSNIDLQNGVLHYRGIFTTVKSGPHPSSHGSNLEGTNIEQTLPRVLKSITVSRIILISMSKKGGSYFSATMYTVETE